MNSYISLYASNWMRDKEQVVERLLWDCHFDKALQTEEVKRREISTLVLNADLLF